LQYVDDTIIFLDHDLEQAKNLKLLLCAFEQLLGPKINFHKNEIFYYGEAKEMELFYTSLFGCNSGAYPFRYLGIPMHHRQLLNSKWCKVEERFQQKLSCWKAKYLSYGGRLVLLNAVLSSLPMFMMSFFEIPKEVLKKLDHLDQDFSGKALIKNTSAGLPDGTSCAGQRIRVASGSWIYSFKTNAFWPIG
jgi:hypothetical protein